MYKKVLPKVIYFLIILIISFGLYNYILNQNVKNGAKPDFDNSYLINTQTADPKRLFLKSWRIIKTKYYDPTLNGQDWTKWNKRYVDQIKTKDDAYVAINTMLASLNDPYSRFMNQQEYAEQNTNIDARIVGIGVNIMSVDGKIIIISVVEDTPSYFSGIKAGDIILKVDKKDVSGKTISDVAALIRGQMGTSVNLELLRGKHKITKTIARDEIKIKNIKASVVDKNFNKIPSTSKTSYTPIQDPKTLNVSFNQEKPLKIKREDLNKEITELYNKSCSELEIQEDLKPVLKIVYENEIYTIFPDGTEEITKSKTPIIHNEGDMGSYDSDEHVITFYANSYINRICNNLSTLIRHELYHAKEAIKRNSIPQEDRNEIVKEALLENIQSGEAPTILMSEYDGTYKTMISPIFDEKTSKDFSAFAEQNLFSDDPQTLEKLKEYYELKYENPKKKNKKKLRKLETELADILTQLQNIKKNNRQYKSQNHSFLHFIRNEKEKDKELLAYSISIASKYQLFRKKEINKELPTIYDYDKKEIKSSIKANIDSVEGNIVLEIHRKNKRKKLENKEKALNLPSDEYYQYLYSKEEFEARKCASNMRIANLSHNMQKCNFIKKQKLKSQIKEIRRKEILDEYNYQLYHLAQEERKKPNDIKIKIKIKILSIKARNINNPFFSLFNTYIPNSTSTTKKGE